MVLAISRLTRQQCTDQAVHTEMVTDICLTSFTKHGHVRHYLDSPL